jgi:hypothetical protein
MNPISKDLEIRRPNAAKGRGGSRYFHNLFFILFLIIFPLRKKIGFQNNSF